MLIFHIYIYIWVVWFSIVVCIVPLKMVIIHGFLMFFVCLSGAIWLSLVEIQGLWSNVATAGRQEIWASPGASDGPKVKLPIASQADLVWWCHFSLIHFYTYIYIYIYMYVYMYCIYIYICVYILYSYINTAYMYKCLYVHSLYAFVYANYTVWLLTIVMIDPDSLPFILYTSQVQYHNMSLLWKYGMIWYVYRWYT